MLANPSSWEATGGIGSAASAALAQMGANIISISIPQDDKFPQLEKTIKSIGREITGYEVDVGDPVALRQCFKKIRDDGHIADILITCAGVNRRTSLLEQTDENVDFVSASGDSPFCLGIMLPDLPVADPLTGQTDMANQPTRCLRVCTRICPRASKN